MDAASASVAATLVSVAGVVAFVHLSRRHRRQERDTALLEEKVEKNLHLPRSLHPQFDPDLCIGSLSCLKGCPEGVLGMVDGIASLVHADHCIGHGTCAAECPAGAIKLVMGTAERGVDLPEVDWHFQSSRPGVHVVGELGGMGLIRNAMQQGLEVAQHLAQALPPAGGGDVADAVVVGAGPAGLATAFGLRAAGRSYRLLEQVTAGGSIAHYPRHKIVMTAPVQLPLYGKIGERRISKEKLLATWSKAIEKGGIRVEEGVKVEGIEGEDGRFVVQTSRGPVKARKVVLAIGRRGTPRRLGVEGEDLPKVSYALVDPEQYQGQRVLVVGGGDAALEAAIQLAEVGSVEVTLSYRGDSLARAREANRAKVEVLAAKGRLRLLLSSEVKAVSRLEVLLVQAKKPIRVVNDYVLVLIGGELPLDFLKKAGVGMRRYAGEVFGPQPAVRAPAAPEEGREPKPSHAIRVYTMVGAIVVALLLAKGWQYYLLPPPQRLRSPLHAALRPAGAWGHGVGIVATAFMLSNFLYAIRKRWRLTKGLGDIRTWLDFHVFVGFMSPLVTAFHAAFQSNNLVATATSVALVVVVLTGMVGRFIYAMVPSTNGQAIQLDTLAAKFERLRDRAKPLLAGAQDPAPLEAVFALATRSAPRVFLPLLTLLVPATALHLRYRLWRVRRLVPDRERRAILREALGRLNRLRFQIAFYDGLRRFLRGWRVFHASLAGFLVAVIAAHVGVALLLGYGLR